VCNFLGAEWLEAVSGGCFSGWTEHSFDWSIIAEIVVKYDL
jgi:hypothetical protein